MFALNSPAAVRDFLLLLNFGANQNKIWKFFRTPDDPTLQGALLTCMSLINTAGLPINVRQKKEKKTVSIKTKTKTLPLSPVARKVLGNALFFLSSFSINVVNMILLQLSIKYKTSSCCDWQLQSHRACKLAVVIIKMIFFKPKMLGHAKQIENMLLLLLCSHPVWGKFVWYSDKWVR